MVDEYLGERRAATSVLTGVKLRSTKDGSTRDLTLDGLSWPSATSPNTAVFKGQLATTPEGYLLTRTALAWKGVEAPAGLLDRMPNYGTATSVEGVFACGDVVDTHYRQAITAAGSGCAAAMDCEKWLEATGGDGSTERRDRPRFRLDRAASRHHARQCTGDPGRFATGDDPLNFCAIFAYNSSCGGRRGRRGPCRVAPLGTT